MSDQTTFINTYVDTVVETLHNNVNEIMQLKTSLKIANNLVLEKDQVITNMLQEKDQTVSDLSQQKDHVIDSLNKEIDSLREQKINSENSINHLNDSLNNAKRWEEQYHAMVNKVSNMDALSNQFNDLKTEFKSKNVECDNLKEENERFKEEIKTLTKQIKEYEKKYKIEKPIAEAVINKKETKSSAVVEKVKPLEPSKVIMKVEVKNENDDF